MSKRKLQAVDKDTQANFQLNHVYIKDLSFEVPQGAMIFQKKWQPKVHVDLSTPIEQLSGEVFEVSVFVTVTVQAMEEGQERQADDDKNKNVAYIAEAKQAGIFTAKNHTPEHLEHFLNVYCPNMLFPYLRETVSNMIVKGGFSPIYLAPIDFESLYLQRKAQQDSK